MMNLRSPLNSDARLPWEDELSLEAIEGSLPDLSVVIPIYNSGKFLEKTIRSLMCNNLDGVELILMDGGSTDNTMDIVKHYEDIFSFIHSSRDAGQSDAINRGYSHANGEIYYWLNGDDIILPNTLNKVRAYFTNYPDCSVLVGNAYMTELDFSPINHFVFSEEKLSSAYLLDYARNHLIQPSVFFTKAAWNQVGPLNIDDHYAMDADLFIGMSMQFKLHHLDLDLAYSVYHEDCKTRGARAESITSLALVQAKHGGFKEASDTLNILVDLYKELESQATKSTQTVREKVLEAQISSLKAHYKDQKELLLSLDLERNR